MPPEMRPELQAFLQLMCWAEGTLREKEPYRTTYGYGHKIKSFSNHPALTGEWQGVRLKGEFCRKAGFKPGCRSTAAGAFQITKSTWQRLQKKFSHLLPDFSPPSQDRAACILLLECGALALLEKGEILPAIEKASRLWASLPGSSSGQPQRKMKNALLFFGGTLALLQKEKSLPPLGEA